MENDWGKHVTLVSGLHLHVHTWTHRDIYRECFKMWSPWFSPPNKSLLIPSINRENARPSATACVLLWILYNISTPHKFFDKKMRRAKIRPIRKTISLNIFCDRFWISTVFLLISGRKKRGREKGRKKRKQKTEEEEDNNERDRNKTSGPSDC